MDQLPLEIHSSTNNGKTKSGDIVAYYEHRILCDGVTESLLVSFLKDKSIEIAGDNMEPHIDINEESMNASIEYANGFFRCQIKEQENIHLLWDMFWQIFNQLKNG